MSADDWLNTITQEDARKLLPTWEASALRHSETLGRLRAAAHPESAGQTLNLRRPDPGTPGTPVQVLMIWSDQIEDLKDLLNPILSLLVAAGVIENAHPDGASEGWEWRPA